MWCAFLDNFPQKPPKSENYHVIFLGIIFLIMIFVTKTGSGRIGWVDDRDMYRMDIERGDIYRLESGSIFYVQSYAETPLDKLRIYALFRTGEIGENSQVPTLSVS